MLDIIKLIFISLLPWIELRGSIPLGIAMGLDPLYVFFICTITDIVLIPIIFLTLKVGVPIILKIKLIDRIYQWCIIRILYRFEKYKKWERIGLILFVAIPFPFTGVYSGTLASYLLNFKKKEAFLSISMGATIAGIIVTLLSIGIFGAGLK